MSLYDRVRPGSEAAPWVCEEIKKLEEQIAQLECIEVDTAIPDAERPLVTDSFSIIKALPEYALFCAIGDACTTSPGFNLICTEAFRKSLARYWASTRENPCPHDQFSLASVPKPVSLKTVIDPKGALTNPDVRMRQAFENQERLRDSFNLHRYGEYYERELGTQDRWELWQMAWRASRD